MSSVATTRHQAQNKTSEPRSPKNYPVHGEGLLKMHKSDKKQALCNSANPDPRADDKKLAGWWNGGSRLALVVHLTNMNRSSR